MTTDLPQSSPPAITDRRGRGQQRVLWARDRARNALRRPAQIGMVGGGVSLIILLTLIFVPQSQRRGAALLPRSDEWRDTAAAQAELVRARTELAVAAAALNDARRRATELLPQPAPVVRTLTPSELARRDSLRAIVNELQPLLDRADRAPLPASYRAIGEAAAVAGNSRVRVLLDTLMILEQEREAFGALGGVDPVYVSLTTRANALGRGILEIAVARRSDALQGIAELNPVSAQAPVPVSREPVDTLGPAQLVADGRSEMLGAIQLLGAAREHNAALDRRVAEAQRLASLGAPPLAILLAALVLGSVAGYGLVLAAELRSPRLASVAEAERVSGSRVIAIVRPEPPSPETARRQADLVAPPLLQMRLDAYRLLHSHVATTGAVLQSITVSGFEPAVVATVACNLAARAALEARSAAVVDLDTRHGLVASVIRVRHTPGVAEVAAGAARWSEAAVTATIGRDLTLDVYPGGSASRAGAPIGPQTRMHVERLAAHYDLTVLAAPVAAVIRGETLMTCDDVVVCARVAVTRTRDLHTAADALRAAGMRLHGIVLWDAEGPHVERYLAGAPAHRTAERHVSARASVS